MDLSSRFMHIDWLIDYVYNPVVIVMADTLCYFLDNSFNLVIYSTYFNWINSISSTYMYYQSIFLFRCNLCSYFWLLKTSIYSTICFFIISGSHWFLDMDWWVNNLFIKYVCCLQREKDKHASKYFFNNSEKTLKKCLSRLKK